MLTEEQIYQVFREMGLGKEEKRVRFKNLSKLCHPRGEKSKQVFIRGAITTSAEEDTEDAELA